MYTKIPPTNSVISGGIGRSKRIAILNEDKKRKVKILDSTKDKLIERRGINLVEGETIEKVIQRMLRQNEPIPQEIGVVMAETEGKNYSIKYDKFETMMEEKSKVIQMESEAKNKVAERKAAKEAGEAGKTGEGENMV